jgi:hypothetical protein
MDFHFRRASRTSAIKSSMGFAVDRLARLRAIVLSSVSSGLTNSFDHRAVFDH